MNGEQLHQLAIEAARNLPFSEQTYPFGPEYEVFKILLCTRQISQNPYPIRILLS